MFNKDVATGKIADTGYTSAGLTSAFTKSETPPPEADAQCYLWDILETCTKLEKQVLKNGTGIIEDFILVGHKMSNGTVVFNNGTTHDGLRIASSSLAPASPTASSAGIAARGDLICAASLSTGVLVVIALGLY